MALKSQDDQHDDKGEYRLDIWRPNLGKCQGLGGKIRRSEGYWKNHRHMITVNNMAIITRKKEKVKVVAAWSCTNATNTTCILVLQPFLRRISFSNKDFYFAFIVLG